MKKYFGQWKSFHEVEIDFQVKTLLRPQDILFAAYDADGFYGDAIVLFVSPIDGRLYLVEAAHESYNNLAGTWRPERTSWTALNKRKLIKCEEEAKVAFRKLIQRNLKS